MKFLPIFLSIGLVHAIVRVGPGVEPAGRVVQRQMNALDLVANSRDINGFNRMLSSNEAHRWGNPNNFFDRYEGRHLTAVAAQYERSNTQIVADVAVSGGRHNDGGFGNQIRMAMSDNGHGGWKIKQILNHPGVNRGKK